MTQAKYTPGPWAYIVPDGYVVRHPQIYSDFGPIANATWLGENKLDQLKSNASLIAAAPTMLEALQCCREALRRTGHDGELTVVDAAIAKATGAE